jgi:hypothetical protein
MHVDRREDRSERVGRWFRYGRARSPECGTPPLPSPANHEQRRLLQKEQEL